MPKVLCNIERCDGVAISLPGDILFRLIWFCSVLLCTRVSLKICAQDVRLIIQSLFSGYDEEYTPLSF